MQPQATPWYMMDGEQYITVDQVAKLLDCAPITIYRKIWAGKLKATKISKTYYIAKPDFEALVKPPEWPIKPEPQAIEA